MSVNPSLNERGLRIFCLWGSGNSILKPDFHGWQKMTKCLWKDLVIAFFCVLEICDKVFPFLSFWNIFPLVKGGIFNLYPQIWFSRWAKPLDSSAWLQRQPVESVSGGGEGELQRLRPGPCSCPSPLCSVLAFPLQGEDKCGNHYSLYHFEALAGLTGWFGSKILSHWTPFDRVQDQF